MAVRFFRTGRWRFAVEKKRSNFSERTFNCSFIHTLVIRYMRRYAIVMVLGFVIWNAASAQDAGKPAGTPKTVRIIPGARYAAGGFHRFWFGDLWRDLWTTEIEVEVLDFDTFAGGLKPLKRGGGFQTKSLRFTGANGVEYKFRSLDKDPAKVLPPEFQNTFVSDIVQDLISTSNPLSAFIATPLLNAVGIPNAAPTLVVMPDDDRLGEFRKEFAGLLGTVEVNPEGGSEEIEGLAESDKVTSTLSLFAKMDKDHDNYVDAVAYLKARIMDIFMGDWDRHTDQWRWARFRDGKQDRWEPIPRDRDQAFCRYDGLIPGLAATAVTQIEGCADEYPKIADLTWSGRYMDRRFLSSLERPTYDSLAAFVVSRMTDSLISNAVHRMPAEMYSRSGAGLERVLRSRRNALREAVAQYYEDLAETVDVYGSDKPEYLYVNRLNDEDVEVTLFAKGKSKGEAKGAPLFHRIFHHSETEEIRVYLLGGDDTAELTGVVDNSITVRIICGDGEDTVIDDSRVEGYFLSLIPFIPSAERRTYVYDSGKKTTVKQNGSTSVDHSEYTLPEEPEIRYQPLVNDRGLDWRLGSLFGLTPDLGPLVGTGAILYSFGFRDEPYTYRMSLLGGYAPIKNLGKLVFTGEFHSLIRGARVDLDAVASGYELLHFYGFGNENRVADPKSDSFRVRQIQYILEPKISVRLSKTVVLGAVANLKDVRNSDRQGTILSQSAQLYPDNTLLCSIGLKATLDSRDNIVSPSNGILFETAGQYTPKLFDNKTTFSRVSGDARWYFPIPFPGENVLALRCGGEKLFGAYPFFEAAFLGGNRNNRGYLLNRFAGDAVAYAGAEFRVPITRLRIVFPTTLGLVGFAETGRVWYDTEGVSKLWHPAYGGGISLAPISRDFTFSVVAAHSVESFGIFMSAGFAW